MESFEQVLDASAAGAFVAWWGASRRGPQWPQSHWGLRLLLRCQSAVCAGAHVGSSSTCAVYMLLMQWSTMAHLFKLLRFDLRKSE
uniref:Uncharacterized protein n=1 Tax=Hyaloperonospora arabidopsidis (strain Emoy2) TaxID=559515 RepID=M4BI94_HYAAE